MFIDDAERPISLWLLLQSSGEICGERLGNQAINKVSDKGMGSAANRPRLESALFLTLCKLLENVIIKPVEAMEG